MIYIFLDLLWSRYNCVKFFLCGIPVKDFKEGTKIFVTVEKLPVVLIL